METLRQKIWAFLESRRGYTSLADIYKKVGAENYIQKTAVRNMLCKGLCKQFTRHPKYIGFYKAVKK